MRPGPTAYHVSATDAVIDRDVDAFVAEVVGDRQALQSPAVGRGVTDEVHAPDHVGAARLHQRLTLGRWPPGLPAAAHGKVRLAEEAIHLLVVHAGKLLIQQVMQAAIAEPAPDPGQLDDACRQRLRGGCRFGWMAVGSRDSPARRQARRSLNDVRSSMRRTASRMCCGLAFYERRFGMGLAVNLGATSNA